MAENRPVEFHFYERLIGNPALAAVIDRKVFPLVVPQGVKPPCIVYARTGEAPFDRLCGRPAASSVIIAVDGFAKSYEQSKELMSLVRGALDGASFHPTLVTSSDRYDDVSTLFHVHMEFSCYQTGVI